MSFAASNLALSPHDRVRVAAVELLAASGASAVGPLVQQLGEPSWAVRRRIVAALAELGDASTSALCELLARRHPSEAAIAAAVDALSASTGAPESQVRALAQSANPAVVCDAAQVLGRRRSVESVPLLAQLLQHPDDNVAVAAVEALGRIGGDAALDAVTAGLGATSFFRIFPTIDVLAQSRDFRAVPPLVKLLADPLYEAAAARALGQIGGSRAVSALVEKMNSATDASLLGPLCLALVELHLRPTAPADVPGLVRSAFSSAQVARLSPVLARGEIAERQAACEVLSWVGGAEAVALLVPQLDSELAVAEQAAAALAKLPADARTEVERILEQGAGHRRRLLLPALTDKALAPAVTACLEDPDPTVRARASEALGRLGALAAIPRLFQQLADRDLVNAQAALAAIQSLGSAETERLALEATGASTPAVKRAAFRIIGYFGYRSALPAAVAAAQSTDERVRDAAIQSLSYIEEPGAEAALTRLAKDPNERTRASAMRALGHRVEGETVAGVLTEALSDPDAWVRYYACQAIARRGEPVGEERLIALTADPAGQVRVAAIEALARAGTDRAAEVLAAATESPDPDIQRAALIGMGLMKGSSRVVPILLRALESSEAATRLVALSSVAQAAEADALPAMLRAAGDPDEGVRTSAIGLLATRGTEAATAALIALLPDERVHGSVQAALAVPSPARISAMLNALETADDETALSLVLALRQMPADGGFKALIAALQSAGKPGRKAAARMLAFSNSRDARAALQRAATSDPDPELRALCQLAIAS